MQQLSLLGIITLQVYLLNADSKKNFDEIKDYVLSKFNHLSSVSN